LEISTPGAKILFSAVVPRMMIYARALATKKAVTQKVDRVSLSAERKKWPPVGDPLICARWSFSGCAAEM
jgi:hypothetical protein